MIITGAVKKSRDELRSIVSKESSDFNDFMECQKKKLSLLKKVKSYLFFTDTTLLETIKSAITSQKNILIKLKNELKDENKVIESLSQKEGYEENMISTFFHKLKWTPQDAKELFYDLKFETQIEREITKLIESTMSKTNEILEQLNKQEKIFPIKRRYNQNKARQKLIKLFDVERGLTLGLFKVLRKEMKKIREYFSKQSLSYTLETKIIPRIKHMVEGGITPEKLIFVHMTNYFPSRGVIKTRLSSDYSPRNTLHFTTNSPVPNVANMETVSWKGKPIAILIPGARFPYKRMKSFAQYDTFIIGNLKLHPGTLILTNYKTALKEAKNEKLPYDNFIDSYRKKGIKIHIVEKGKTVYDEVNVIIRKVGREVRQIRDFREEADIHFAGKMGVKSRRHGEQHIADMDEALGELHFTFIPYLRSPRFYKKRFLLSRYCQDFKNKNFAVRLGFDVAFSAINLLSDKELITQPKITGMAVSVLEEYFRKLYPVIDYQVSLLKEYYFKEDKIEKEREDLDDFFKRFWGKVEYKEGICKMWKKLTLPKNIKIMYPRQSRSIESNIAKIDPLIEWINNFVIEFVKWCTRNNIRPKCIE